MAGVGGGVTGRQPPQLTLARFLAGEGISTGISEGVVGGGLEACSQHELIHVFFSSRHNNTFFIVTFKVLFYTLIARIFLPSFISFKEVCFLSSIPK